VRSGHRPTASLCRSISAASSSPRPAP
jgi:hypothetical protein